jgi:hypothetical protein
MDRPGSADDLPGLAPYVFWGALVGLIAALVTVFVVSVGYAHTLGLAPASCAVTGCVMTVMLSQPAGLCGLAAGAASGAVCGLVGHYLRHRLRAG